jgi:S1-C subfamily serine protease
MVFPPAILAVPIVIDAQVGESYDMIIGVDGNRVTNFLDFEDRMRQVRGGELVYFSIVRDGHRKQITVKVPADMANLAW